MTTLGSGVQPLTGNMFPVGPAPRQDRPRHPRGSGRRSPQQRCKFSRTNTTFLFHKNLLTDRRTVGESPASELTEV
jgi:hypothetical protein